jgi:hypothetical protein
MQSVIDYLDSKNQMQANEIEVRSHSVISGLSDGKFQASFKNKGTKKMLKKDAPQVASTGSIVPPLDLSG